jgi:hypothetical protein
MSVNDTNRNGSMPTTVEESTLPVSLHEPPLARESTVVNGKPELAAPFATRTDVKGVEGISPGRNHLFEIKHRSNILVDFIFVSVLESF